MKKIKKNNSTKVALFAGAAALMALTPQTHAQSSVDALLNKLEQKGVLTVDEADQLKAENATNSVADFNAAMNSRFPMPSWITGYKLSGDFRGRFDAQSSDNSHFVDRDRLRYRLRAGLAIDMTDNLEAGFRLGTGDGPKTQGGDPLSNNTTLTGDASKKYVYIDTAYGKWTPINDGTWMLSGTIGKMGNPFDFTPMVFDPDLTPEGGAIQSTYKINDHNSLAFNGAAFVLDELSGSTRDPFMYGAQMTWNAKWTPKIASSLGISILDIANRANLNGLSGNPANLPLSNTSNEGNTRNAAGNLIYNYNPVVIDGSVTYALDSFPLYKGAFPIKFAAEYINNPGASDNNEGFWGGITLGKSGKKGTWDISYRYEYLEQDAWWDQVVDDDNVAYMQTAPNTGWIAGLVGGTNVKGSLVKVDYSLADALTFSFTCYLNELIHQTINGVSEPQSGAMHAEVDLMWKF